MESDVTTTDTGKDLQAPPAMPIGLPKSHTVHELGSAAELLHLSHSMCCGSLRKAEREKSSQLFYLHALCISSTGEQLCIIGWGLLIRTVGFSTDVSNHNIHDTGFRNRL